MKQTFPINPGDTSVTVETLAVFNGGETNLPPVVTIGSNITIKAPLDSVLLDVGATDPDGQIVAFYWEKVSGGACIFSSPSMRSTNVTGLVPGVYVFRLTATDNDGASTHVQTTVTVLGGPANKIPVVKAGVDQAIVLPANSVNLTGSATDPDTGGTISAYLWEKRSGSGEIESPNSQNTKITNLAKGSSVFRLTAIDNLGASGFDDVGVLVSDAATPPPPPPVGYTLVYENGFEKMTDLTDGNGQYGNGKISTTVFKEGSGSFYSIPQNVSSGIRSELQGFPTPTEGAMEWWANYEKAVSNNGHSWQIHPNTGGGSASPGLWHIGGKFVLVNWYQGGNSEYPTGVTIPQNKWIKIRIEYKTATSGYLRMFIDGAKVLDKAGIRVGDGSGGYGKIGWNGWGSDAATSRIYIDGFRVYKKS